MKSKYFKITAICLSCMLTILTCGSCSKGDSVRKEIEKLDKAKDADVIFVAIQHETGTSCDFYA